MNLGTATTAAVEVTAGVSNEKIIATAGEKGVQPKTKLRTSQCRYCHNSWHMENECRKKTRICFRCQQPGHFANTCTNAYVPRNC